MLRPTLWALAVFPALALLVARQWIPESATRAAGRLDWAGASLLSLGLLLLFTALSSAGRVGAPLTVAVLAAGAVLLTLFVRQQRRSADPPVSGPASGSACFPACCCTGSRPIRRASGPACTTP